MSEIFKKPKAQQRIMKLIAIEGPDKVGKATQSKLLADALNCERVEIPFNDGLTYQQIYAMLKDGTAKTYPQVFQTFHAANRMAWQQWGLVGYKHLDEIIVLDRWIASSYAYGRPFGLTNDFFECVNRFLKPADLTIVLDGPMFGEGQDVYERSDFQEQVRSEYLRWALDNDAPIVAANRSREIVHQDILSIVKKVFS